jgi:hypothetical protein
MSIRTLLLLVVIVVAALGGSILWGTGVGPDVVVWGS